MTFWHGCAMVASKYPDRTSTGDILEYSADSIATLGFSTVKVYLEPGFATSYVGETWSPSNPTSLVTELQTAAFQHLLNLPLDRYLFQCWAFANGNQSWWLSDVGYTALQNEYTEMYNAAVYLLSNFANKDFIFNNWEADWQLLGNFDPTTVIPPYRVERYTAWHQKRQQAIRDAVRDTPSTSTVRYCMEVNRVLDDYGFRAVRDVVPNVKPDMLSWSAYESIDFWYNEWIRSAANLNWTSGDIKSMCMGTVNGVNKYVAVGTNGQLSVSFDGLKWFPRNSQFGTSTITGVTFVSSTNTFVIVGAGGLVANSTDGENWTLRTSGTASNLNGVLTNTSNILAYGAAGTIISSGDGGTTWGAPFWIGGGRPTNDLTCHTYDYVAFIGAIGGVAGEYVYTDGFATKSQPLSTSGNNINCITSTGHLMLVGCDGGIILAGTTGFFQPTPVGTPAFGTDAIRGIAFGTINGVDTAVATGTNGKISSATIADWTTWTARTSGTGAYLDSCIFSPTELCFAYGCDGATGYSFDGINWTVNGQAAMGGLNVNIFTGLFQAGGLTFTLSTAATMSVAKFWHPQSSIEDGISFYMARGYNIMKNSVPPGTPIVISEYSFPSEMTAFTGPGPVIGRTINKVVTTAQSLGMQGAAYWEIFDNEEQSVGVPKGFLIYDRNGSSTTAGPIAGPGIEYQTIIGNPPPLPVLHKTITTDVDLVADDWSGSGNWTSRDANSRVATLTGSLTKQTTSQFSTRHEILGWTTSNFFQLPSSTSNFASQDFTYELIVKLPAATGSFQTILETQFTSQPGAIIVTLNPTTMAPLFGVTDSGSTQRSATGASLASLAGDYVYLAFTCSTGSNNVKAYVNGVLSGTQGTLTTYAASSAITLNIGTFSATPFGGNIVEFMRHQSALSAAQIAARAVVFNALKGY